MKNSSNILQEHLNNLSWLSNAINRFSGNRVLVRDLQVEFNQLSLKFVSKSKVFDLVSSVRMNAGRYF